MIKILVADDEPAERESLQRMIQSMERQTEVRAVENGRLAVINATLWKADLLVMDIEMPGLNGIEASRQILSELPSCKVIFVTAYPLFVYALDAIRLGADDYILKPVEKDNVLSSVEKACSQIDAERRLASLGANEIEAEGGQDRSAQIISLVLDYLDKNYMRYDLTLDRVADILGLNPSYLSSLFKRLTGVNFSVYITDKRISHAKELLKDPLRSASEIAGLTGYESASYFTRAFKKKTGLTPTEYRKSLRGKGRDE